MDATKKQLIIIIFLLFSILVVQSVYHWIPWTLPEYPTYTLDTGREIRIRNIDEINFVYRESSSLTSTVSTTRYYLKVWHWGNLQEIDISKADYWNILENHASAMPSRNSRHE